MNQLRIMCRYSIVLSLLLTVLFLAGCRTYQPPQRAAAYMFPSLVPGGMLSSLCAHDVTGDELTEFLDSNSLLDTLDKAGLPREELSIIIRGLKRRGYAEIDARRSGQKLQWIVFAGNSKDEIAVTVYMAGDGVKNIVWHRPAENK